MPLAENFSPQIGFSSLRSERNGSGPLPGHHTDISFIFD
jgi:hypothetical protein